MKIVHLLGIAGVESHEQSAARLWAKRLEWPMLIVVLWIPIQWYLEETHAVSSLFAHIIDWLIWLVFLVETILLTNLVRNKKRYLLHNWMNVAIIVGGLPIAWQYTPLVGLMRSMRLALAVVLLVRMSKTIRALLSRHQLGTTLALAFITMVLSGIIISRIDPSIGTIWDGMWWAWVTMASVGYGDVVPQNTGGRLFGALLILFGVVLVSLLTANLSAFFIGGDVEKIEKGEEETDRLLRDVAVRLERIERLVEEQQKCIKSDQPGNPGS